MPGAEPQGKQDRLPVLSSFFKLLSVHKNEVAGAGEGASNAGMVCQGYRSRVGVGSEEQLWRQYVTLGKSHYPLGISSLTWETSALLFGWKRCFQL